MPWDFAPPEWVYTEVDDVHCQWEWALRESQLKYWGNVIFNTKTKRWDWSTSDCGGRRLASGCCDSAPEAMDAAENRLRSWGHVIANIPRRDFKWG